MNNQKLIFLAAGLGSRLRPLTDDRPKCMVKVSGKAIISHLLDNLDDKWTSETTIVTGYKSDILVNYLGEKYNYVHNELYEQTNMLYSFWLALKELDGVDVIVSYTDILYSTRILNSNFSQNSILNIISVENWKEVWETRFSDPLGDLESFKVSDGRITEIGSRVSNLNEIEGQYSGIFFIPRSSLLRIQKIIDSLPEENRMQWSMTEFFRYLIDLGYHLSSKSDNFDWFEFDCLNDIHVYEKKKQICDEELKE